MITKTAEEYLNKEAFSVKAIPTAFKAFTGMFNKSRLGTSRAAAGTPMGFMDSARAGWGSAGKVFRSVKGGGAGHKPLPAPRLGLSQGSSMKTLSPGESSKVHQSVQATRGPGITQTGNNVTSTPKPGTTISTTNTNIPAVDTGATPKSRFGLGVGVGVGLTGLGGYGTYKGYTSYMNQPQQQTQAFNQNY